MKSTKNILELLDLILAGVDVATSSLKDGKIGFDDAAQLMKLIPVAGPAVQDIKEVWPELLDMDAAEGAQIVGYVSTKLSIDSVKAKAVALASLEFVLAGHKLFLAVKA